MNRWTSAPDGVIVHDVVVHEREVVDISMAEPTSSKPLWVSPIALATSHGKDARMRLPLSSIRCIMA